MNHVFRHDAIKLRKNVSKEDFERFIKEELFPVFNEVYKGPTRTSKADLTSQSLVEDPKGQNYIWITSWNGTPEAVKGSSFENTRATMNEGMHKAEALLQKLDVYGIRATAKVFNEVHHAETPVNA